MDQYAKIPELTGCYQPGLCPDNIYRLIDHLKKTYPGEDFSKSEVLYIYSSWHPISRHELSSNRFVPLRSRNGTPKPLMFHVVLQHRGKIYDLDHNSQNATVSLKQYFEEMFGARWHPEGSSPKEKYTEIARQFLMEEDSPSPAPGSSLRLHVRAIPAETYRKEYSLDRTNKGNHGLKIWSDWLNDEEHYPGMTLEEFLIKKEATSQ